MQAKEKKTVKEKKYKMPEGFHVEMDRWGRGIKVAVSGVISITDLDESSCILKLRRGRMGILGSGLSVSVFENGVVSVFGNVERLELL